jgi:Alpha/beta hydrolase domain
MHLPAHSLLLALAFIPISARCEVISVEILQRENIVGSDYETLRGRLHFAVDPDHARNRAVADLDLVTRASDGLVHFSSDFRLIKPQEGAPAAHAGWVEIPNRGSTSGLRDFMIQHRFAMLEVGWEFDVPPAADRLSIAVPVAREKDGSPLRGIVEAIFVLDDAENQVPVTDLEIYPPVDPEGPDSRLIVRERGDRPGGREIPRDQWSLSGHVVTLREPFQPGLTYEIRWLAENPPLAGLGLAAIRDATSWLKNKDTSLAPVPHAYAFGASQCGRLLRDFVYQGFNTDEAEGAVFDGIMAHIAGAGRLDLNRRWSTPRELALYRTASYPFADNAHLDPVSGLKEGILENPRVTHRPRIFYTNTSAEYWGAGRVAALVHTDPAGLKDTALPDNVRLYVFAGTQHGPSAFPPQAPAEDGLLSNPVDFRPSLLTLRLAMHRWISEGIAPPESAYPKIADGTLVPASQIKFPDLPGVPSPKNLQAGLRVANTLLAKGARAGTELHLLVPQVDADGNELAGIRLPEIAVPLATATGWMFRPPSMGAHNELLPVLRGSWIPFPLTQKEREKSKDPRPSRQERYSDRETFLQQSRAAAVALAQDGYLLPEYVDEAVELAAERWDWSGEPSL